MCGICGILNHKTHAPVDIDLLRRMRDAMIHRGPDDSGLHVDNKIGLGLGFRRLSIIDLTSAGHQPMSNAAERVWLVFNGEIYNFKEIRKELEQKGYTFRSRTDSEVIIHSYDEWGTDCIHKFNGMFAFAIYDGINKKLFLARDRAGQKPLYYARYKGRFSFSSELKALLQDPDLSREIDIHALNYYLTFGYIGGSRCIFKHVKKLPPAHAMIIDMTTGKEKIWHYWDPPPPTSENIPEMDILEELRSLLKDAIRLRMVSDVPLGAFLSGGLDSSLIVALMSKLSDSPVKAFSVGFDEGKYNELPYARIIAKRFPIEHHEIIVKPDAFSILEKLVCHFDEPFADSSMVPTYYLSKFTKEYVTVALSGDGGDELFGGYSQYLGTMGNYYASKIIPYFIRKQIADIADSFPETLVGKRQLLRLKYDPFGAFIDRVSHLYFKSHMRKLLLNNDLLSTLNNAFLEPEESHNAYLTRSKRDFINTMTYTDFKTYLPDDILVKVDRVSMLNSLEVRSPFLDYRISDFSFKYIRGNQKVKRTVRKYMLKKLAMGVLPQELDINRKWGFAIPVSEWFRGSLSSVLQDRVLPNKNGLFNKNYIEKLLKEHKLGVNHRGRLFTLLAFSIWHDNL
jgi:asparagine synthase (glutamine-hydrolysing)